MRTSLLGACLLLCAPLRAATTKKVIYHGWGTPDTRYVRAHWREMERVPFDGIAISVAIDRAKPSSGDGASANLLGWNSFGPRRLRAEDFKEAIADLRSARFSRFTTNFLPLSPASLDQDHGFGWFDDARWETIAGNWEVAARIAKEGGLKGLLIDPEHYGVEFFNHSWVRAREGRSSREAETQVRLRGRQLMTAVRKAHPKGTFLFLYAHSLLVMQRAGSPPASDHPYALLPAFIDGLMEAAHPSARFVDMGEHAYGYTRPEQFEAFAGVVYGAAADYSAVPDLNRARMRAGFGLWLDEGKHGGPAGFARALRAALEHSDEYVWIYSQRAAFFPPAGLPPSALDALASR